VVLPVLGQLVDDYGCKTVASYYYFHFHSPFGMVLPIKPNIQEFNRQFV